MTTPFAGTEAEIGQGCGKPTPLRQRACISSLPLSVMRINRRAFRTFDSKYEVEKHIAKIGVRATILAPVAFMENIYFIKEYSSRKGPMPALSPGRAHAQIAVADIGAVAVRVLEDHARFTGKRIDLAWR